MLESSSDSFPQSNLTTRFHRTQIWLDKTESELAGPRLCEDSVSRLAASQECTEKELKLAGRAARSRSIPSSTTHFMKPWPHLQVKKAQKKELKLARRAARAAKLPGTPASPTAPEAAADAQVWPPSFSLQSRVVCFSAKPFPLCNKLSNKGCATSGAPPGKGFCSLVLRIAMH